MNMCLYKNISDSIRLYDCPTVMDGHVFTLAWPERKHRHIAIDFVMATVGAEAQKLHEKLDWTLLTMRPPLMSDDDYDDDDIAKMCKKEKMRNTKKTIADNKFCGRTFPLPYRICQMRSAWESKRKRERKPADKWGKKQTTNYVDLYHISGIIYMW